MLDVDEHSAYSVHIVPSHICFQTFSRSECSIKQSVRAECWIEYSVRAECSTSNINALFSDLELTSNSQI